MNPRVYIASLEAYNSGILHGQWVDADDIENGVIEVLDTCPKNDYEYFHVDLCEYSSVDTVLKYVEICDYFKDEEQAEAYFKFCEHVGLDWSDEEYTAFEESYQGCFDCQPSFTEEYVDSIGLLDSIPDDLKCYFDYEKFNRDLFMCDFFDIECSQGGIFVFLNC